MKHSITARSVAMAWVLVIACLSGTWASAQTRPVIVEASETITRPDVSWDYFGRYVAIDGDWALIQADRYVPDESAETGTRHDGAALLFHRNGGTWTYAGVLGPIGIITEWVKTGLAMKSGVAMVIEDRARVFERTGTTWTQIPTDPTQPRLQGPDIEIDSGRILAPQTASQWNGDVFGKSGGVWRREATLIGHTNSAPGGDEPPTPSQDLQGTRAIIFNETGADDDPPVARLYRPSTAAGWEQFAVLSPPLGTTVFGPHAALHGTYVAVSGSVENGTWLYHDLGGGTFGGPVTVLQPADGYMQPGSFSTTTLEHGSGYLFQRNFSHDRNAWVVNVFAAMNHVATLVAKNGASLGRSIDVSGNRIIVSGLDFTAGDNTVHVFDLPPNPTAPGLHQDDFEQSGAGADWQPIAGSAFTVAQSGDTRVYRQTSVAGNAASLLPASESKDQAIQVEVTPTSFSGADRWFGLMTRQTDTANYYYVTARSSGTIQLRKIVNNTFTTLASAPYSITANRKYRLRLESIGTVHRVYVDDKLLLTARDGALTHGRAGVIMYRTSADYDNVMVSPTPFATIYSQNFNDSQQGRWAHKGVGAWIAEDGVYRQVSTADGARSLTGAYTYDQVVQVRVRPTSFNGADRWAGVIARYENDQNYLYVTLRSSNVLSLRQLAFGEIHVISEQPLTVTPGTWYTLRIEKIGRQIRVYVNDTLRLSAEDPSGLPGGQVGLVTYKAAAEFDDFLSYQP